MLMNCYTKRYFAYFHRYNDVSNNHICHMCAVVTVITGNLHLKIQTFFAEHTTMSSTTTTRRSKATMTIAAAVAMLDIHLMLAIVCFVFSFCCYQFQYLYFIAYACVYSVIFRKVNV